jgi:hypothetical protein
VLRPWSWSLFQGDEERGLIPYAHSELRISAIAESGGIVLKASNSRDPKILRGLNQGFFLTLVVV